jgi:DnaK suppressor protein
MDPKRLSRFKKTLQTRRRELRRSIAEAQHAGRTIQQAYGPDEGDRAHSSHDKELLFHRSTHARGLLQAVEAALSGISEGTFGNCLRCGEEINTKRLEAVPSTRYCLTCQELLEGKD